MPRRVSFSEANHHTKPIKPPSITITFPTTAKNCPATKTRPPATYTTDYIDKPGVARGNTAISIDRPDGAEEAYTRRFGEFTPLQQHILFWDRDQDNEIYPWDTYTGFRELGFNMLFSALAAVIVNGGFSYPTRLAQSVVPDLWWRVFVDGIHKGKHGSDSNTFDTEGRFIPQSFENLFAKYDGDGDGGLTLRELWAMMAGNRCVGDFFGWGAALFEWGTTWLLIQREGKVWKEDLRGIYDGSLFWKIREERRAGRGWSQGFGIGDGFVGGVKVY
ncbi:caleosin domain protein [Aspergillus ellipticus CBS 707.79]|uniref:Caleosin domain protein n=1 Tax=Aspergillus ellipticus CBS 707.79 TaxID=1448320 RepID=A0A319D429_9EURO|nr:caleosin domain protein [Aspergillus ellipticus CBS 707.79]